MGPCRSYWCYLWMPLFWSDWSLCSRSYGCPWWLCWSMTFPAMCSHKSGRWVLSDWTLSGSWFPMFARNPTGFTTSSWIICQARRLVMSDQRPQGTWQHWNSIGRPPCCLLWLNDKRTWCPCTGTASASSTASLAMVARGTVPSVVFTSIPACPVTLGISLGSGSAMAVPYSMVLCMDGNRPGLYWPPTILPPSRPLCGGQNTGQILSALDCDLCSLDRGLETRSVRHSYGRDAVSSTHSTVSVLFTGIVLTRTLSLSGHCVDPSCLGLLVSPYRLARFTIQASATTRNRDSHLDSTPTLLRQAHRSPDTAPPVRGSARTAATVTFAANVSANAPDLARAAPADGSVSPSLLRPIRRLSLPLPQSVVLATGPALAPVIAPAYVLFLNDIDVQMSALRGADVPVHPGFEPIDSTHQLIRSGLTSQSIVQPIVWRSGHPYHIPGLSWLPLYFVKGCLMLQLATLGSGINMAVVSTWSRRIRTTNTTLRMARLVCKFTTHNFWSGWGPRNRPAYSDGHPVSGSGPVPGCRPLTLRTSSSVTLTLWPPTLVFWSSMLLACMVLHRMFSSWLSAITVSRQRL